MIERPVGVPEQAVWNDDDNEWVLVSHPDEQGRRHGLVISWRADGSLQDRIDFRHGVKHGPFARYHESGELSRLGAFDNDRVHGTDVSFRSDAPTTELMFASQPDAIARIESEVVHGRSVRTRWFDRDGNELTMTGEPMPERPNGVDERAVPMPDGLWYQGEWDLDTGPETAVGLRRWWQADGTALRVEYQQDGKCVAAADQRPNQTSQANPLVAAAQAGDEAAVLTCLAMGFGAVPGAALHAAYAGVPALAARLVTVSGEPVWPAPAEPDRPGNVAADAVWVPGVGRRGGWLLGERDTETAAAVGMWCLWAAPAPYDDKDEPANLETVEFTDGRPALWRDYYRFRLRRPDDLAARNHRDGFPLREERHHDRQGNLRLRRMFNDEPGQLCGETEHREDGAVANRDYYDGDSLRRERVERDGALLSESWYARDGSHTAEVTAAEPYVDEDGDTVQVGRWRGLDGGRVIAEGLTTGSHSRPIGAWRLLDDSGEEYATVDFTPLTETSLGFSGVHNLGQVAVALHAWEQAPWPDALADVQDVDWAALRTFFGKAKHFPFLLKGLAQPDPLAFGTALDQIADPVLHQQTIEDVAGPTVRYILALLPQQTDPDLRARLLRFAANVATRGGAIGAVARIGRLYRDAPADDPGKFFLDKDTEPAYYEIYRGIAEATPLLAELAAEPHLATRLWALMLLVVSRNEDAGRILLDRIAAEPDQETRAEAVLGLAVQTEAPARDVLAGLMSGKADNPLLAFCAALTWVRTRLEPAEPAVDLLVSALQGDLDPAGFGGLYLTQSSATTDAVTTLALLPEQAAGELLDRLCATLEEVNAINAISVASALLDIVLPRGYEGEPLTAAQRQVVAAIAASKQAWKFNANLHEVLRINSLPTDREKLHALADA